MSTWNYHERHQGNVQNGKRADEATARARSGKRAPHRDGNKRKVTTN
jgi:hypothetical protein